MLTLRTRLLHTSVILEGVYMGVARLAGVTISAAIPAIRCLCMWLVRATPTAAAVAAVVLGVAFVVLQQVDREHWDGSSIVRIAELASSSSSHLRPSIRLHTLKRRPVSNTALPSI